MSMSSSVAWDIPLGGSFERLLVEANYYDIDIEGAIQAPDAQDTLDAEHFVADGVAIAEGGEHLMDRHGHGYWLAPE